MKQIGLINLFYRHEENKYIYIYVDEDRGEVNR